MLSTHLMHNLTPYGHYALLEIESTCFASDLLMTLPPGWVREFYYNLAIRQPPEIPMLAIEETTSQGHQRTMLCPEYGLYLGKRHLGIGPELVILQGEVLYTDSQMQGFLYLPTEACIPEITNGWRAVIATAGTAIQLTDRALEKTLWSGLPQLS